ncbi:MAG: tRNA pseudouridine(38-40) synthase TruA [Puniceicoccales bacterium]|jgi:tRNA pseudouridine38-40 synthase|nr:tRNA pseudouridine(38-40) synthase TruA [Puniceicoccales bacterium]
MTRWCAHCAYDGTPFHGWQSQVGGNTVQDFIEARLGEILHRPIRIHGSGRTDAGVHARDQVFHFDADWAHGAPALLRALHPGLPEEIQIFSLSPVNSSFHARYSALWKRYIYYIHEGYSSPFQRRYVHGLGERRLSLGLLEPFCSALIGSHDFSTFGASRPDQQENPVKHLRRLEFIRKGPSVEMLVESSGYLYKMARRLAGAAMEIALGRLSSEEILNAFFLHEKNEKIPTAPARGLFLDYIYYDETLIRP